MGDMGYNQVIGKQAGTAESGIREWKAFSSKTCMRRVNLEKTNYCWQVCIEKRDSSWIGAHRQGTSLC